MSLALTSRRAALMPGQWVRNELWRRARAVPSLDLRFADNKSLADATTGASLVTFARASSGTYVDSQGVIQSAATNVPRFDHNPTTGESLGLLVEEQRTNLLLRSEEFDNANWGKQNTSVTANTTTSPDGSANADSIFETAANGEHYVRQNFTGLTANTVHTITVFVKDLGGRNLNIRVLDSDNVANGYFIVVSPSLGTVVTAATTLGSGSGAAGSVTPYANGWHRVTLSGNAGATCTKYILDFFSYSGTTLSFAGDITKGLILWGAQLEAGAFPTSYIKTEAATATRSADVASITGTAFSGWYRQDEGSFFCSVNPVKGDVLFGTGDTFDNTQYAVNSSNSNVIIRGGGSSQAVLTAPVSTAVVTNLAFGYQVNNFAACSNGGIITTDASGSVPVSQVRLKIGSSAWEAQASNIANGTIRRLTYWPQRLPDSSIQAITQ